jgi:hypothetical protein
MERSGGRFFVIVANVWLACLGFDGLLLAASAQAYADETVTIAGSRAVLIKPEMPHASVILVPGGDGAIRAGDNGDIHGLLGNQLVRTRHAYAALGLAVLVADVSTDLKSAVDYMAEVKRPVTLIATSNGTRRAAQGIARGARPDALVLTSGFLSPDSGAANNVMSILGSPSALPPTLVIHHREDGCASTKPAGVEPFIRWSAGKARVSWLSGGVDAGDPCEARGHHGFNGLDREVVELAAAFR